MHMGLGRLFPSFLLSNSGMFADIDEGQSNQGEGRVAMAAIDVVAVRDRILALRAAAVRIQLFEAFRIPRNRRKQAQIRLGLDVQGVSHFFLRRGAVLMERALLGMKDPFLLSIFAGTGTGKTMGRFALHIALMPHPAIARTQRRPIGLKDDVRVHLDLGERRDRLRVLFRL